MIKKKMAYEVLHRIRPLGHPHFQYEQGDPNCKHQYRQATREECDSPFVHKKCTECGRLIQDGKLILGDTTYEYE